MLTNDPLHDFVYLYHMPLFFFLSGIVISAAPKPTKVLVKACQFLCPFFIVGGLAYSAYIHGSFHSFIWEQLKYGYWYLQVLTLLYMLLMPFNWSVRGGGLSKEYSEGHRTGNRCLWLAYCG